MHTTSPLPSRWNPARSPARYRHLRKAGEARTARLPRLLTHWQASGTAASLDEDADRAADQGVGKKIHAGMIHAGKTATVICENNRFQVIIDGETAVVVPRTTISEVRRYKANATQRFLADRAQEGQ